MLLNLPLVIWMLFVFFRDIPAPILEAARMDGAGLAEEIGLILIPLALPAIFSTATLSLILAWNESSGKFWEQLKPWEIIWFWWSCHDDENLRNFTEASLKEPKALRRLISSSISTVFSTSGNYEHVDHTSLSCIVDVEQMKAAAEKLPESTNDPSDRQLVDRFQKAVARWSDSPRSRLP